jgi:hypothetical protein
MTRAIDWHQDGYFERYNGERSQFTLMVYLNDGYEGGGTSFIDPYGRLFDPFTVRGLCALFLSSPRSSGRRGDGRAEVCSANGRDVQVEDPKLPHPSARIDGNHDGKEDEPQEVGAAR